MGVWRLWRWSSWSKCGGGNRRKYSKCLSFLTPEKNFAIVLQMFLPPLSAPKLFSLQLAVFEVAIISLSPPRPLLRERKSAKKRGRWKDVSNHGGSLFFAKFAFIVIISSRVGETEGRPLLKMHGLHSSSYSSWWWHNCFETKKWGIVPEPEKSWKELFQQTSSGPAKSSYGTVQYYLT